MSAPPAVKVFISYSHDTVKHKDRILALSDKLRSGGIDCSIDQYEQFPDEGWPTWCEKQVERARFVLIACTETYFRRFRKEEAPGIGLGVVWEGHIIISQLYEAQGNKTYIPITFKRDDNAFIPVPLRTATRFLLDDDYDSLYRLLTGQPEIPKPDLGPVKVMPARPPLERKPYFEEIQPVRAERKPVISEPETIRDVTRTEAATPMADSALSFLIFHADGTRTALCGLPLVHPTVINFLAAPGEPARQSHKLSTAVCDFLRALGPQVQPCDPGCAHDAAGISSCPVCAQPKGVQLLVIGAGEPPTGMPPVPDLPWWTARKENRRVLPVFHEGAHPERVLPAELLPFNAAFWKDSAEELVPTVLSAAGLTPESHRIFISYRRLETERLAEDLFEGLNRLGFDVFLDRYAIPPAVNFQRRLHQDLAEKSMVLLLESDRFGESKWTTEEITYCKRNELGLYALHLPHGMDPVKATRKLPDVPDEWRDQLSTGDFEAPPSVVNDGHSDFMQWGRLTEAARDRITAQVRIRHDAAILSRRQNLRSQMLSELRKCGARDYDLRADGLLAVTSKKDTPYVVWITPRPPELSDFHAAHSGCQFPANTVGVVVGLRNLLEPENKRRLTWLSGLCKLVLVDPGHIVKASRKIAEGLL